MLEAVSFISALLGESFARSTPERGFWWTAPAAQRWPSSCIRTPFARFHRGHLPRNVQGRFPNVAKQYAVLGTCSTTA